MRFEWYVGGRVTSPASIEHLFDFPITYGRQCSIVQKLNVEMSILQHVVLKTTLHTI